MINFRNILLNYAVANPMLGYTQGMSDLLAPVLAETQNEADAYWCFDGLMQKTLFVSSPKDTDMDKQLVSVVIYFTSLDRHVDLFIAEWSPRLDESMSCIFSTIRLRQNMSMLW